MYRWTIEKLKEISDKDFAICILQERLNGLSNPYSPLTEKLRGTIGKLREARLDKTAVEKWKEICMNADNVASEVLDCDEARKELTSTEMRYILEWSGDDEFVEVDDSRHIKVKDGTIARVMKAVDEITSSDYPEPGGLLGFCIENQIDNYAKAGESIIATFKRHPQQADVLEEMLIAICGWGMESLKERMEENADYYSSL